MKFKNGEKMKHPTQQYAEIGTKNLHWKVDVLNPKWFSQMKDSPYHLSLCLDILPSMQKQQSL